jgi:hypothetical protein
MAIIKNATVAYISLDPKHPSMKFDKTRGSWDLQLSTTDPKDVEYWKSIGLKPKLVVHKEDSDAVKENPDLEGTPILTEDGKKQWKMSVRKKAKKKDGEATEPVEVLSGALQPIDPNTIGKGSVVNVRIYQYDYEQDGEKKLGSVLMGIQVIKHVVRKQSVRESFGTENYEVENPIEDDDEPFESNNEKSAASPSPAKAAQQNDAEY